MPLSPTNIVTSVGVVRLLNLLDGMCQLEPDQLTLLPLSAFLPYAFTGSPPSGSSGVVCGLLDFFDALLAL